MIIEVVFVAKNEFFEFGADLSNLTGSGWLGKAAVGVGVEMLSQCSADIDIAFYDSRTQVLVSSDNHEGVGLAKGTVNVALGV
jgi:hypothetical protein